MMDRKRIYVFDDPNEPIRFTVVHTSLKEAKKWLWADMDVRASCDNDYRNFKPYWFRGDASGLEVGDDLISVKGIELGVYEWVDDNCPVCGRMAELRRSYDDDEIRCSECEEKMAEK